MNEERFTISQEDEKAVVSYLLELMKKYALITQEEYQKAMYPQYWGIQTASAEMR